MKGTHDQACDPAFDDSSWEDVDVPHDWAITGPFDKENDKQLVRIIQNNEKTTSEKTGRTGALPHVGEGWYRNTLNLTNIKRGQRVFLLFEGAMAEPTVYLNGNKVGEWNYGYSYFFFDITDEVDPNNPNALAVQLRNRECASRWYPGAGIYRNVKVIIKNANSIAPWGVTVTTPNVSDDESDRACENPMYRIEPSPGNPACRCGRRHTCKG